MKQIILELMKRNPHTGILTRGEADITNLDSVLTPQEIFALEFKINELGFLRAHISVREINADNVGQEGELPRD